MSKKHPSGEAKLPELLTVSPSPHIKHRDTTQSIMADVIIALLPATIWGIYFFGWKALIIVAAAVTSCVCSEAVFQKILGKPITVCDLSAAVTGLLLALNVPVSIPVWMVVVGSVFAIVIVKQLFGGIGKNIVNPALAARVFLMMSFVDNISGASYTIDGVSSATPLVALKNGDIESLSLRSMLLGRTAGCIGEVSAVLLVIGGVYLLCRRVITWHIPVSFIGTVALITFIFPRGDIGNFDITFMLMQVCAGGLMLGAIFMATDYATSPVTPLGRIIYGVLCGLITVFIRYFCGNPEGVSFAILISNLLVFYIEKITLPRRFGEKKIKEEAKA
jgi:electron transport complex protein RnfD